MKNKERKKIEVTGYPSSLHRTQSKKIKLSVHKHLKENMEKHRFSNIPGGTYSKGKSREVPATIPSVSFV